jgi:hypothetical protein
MPFMTAYPTARMNRDRRPVDQRTAKPALGRERLTADSAGGAFGASPSSPVQSPLSSDA